MNKNQQNEKRKPVLKAALLMVFGAILGLIFGSQAGSPAVGLIFGTGLGLIFGAALDRQDKKTGSQDKK